MYRYKNGSHKFNQLVNKLSQRVTPLERSALQLPVIIYPKGYNWKRADYRLQSLSTLKPRKLNDRFDKAPRMASATCENCGRKCSFSILESADMRQAVAFCKANMQRIGYCPRVAMNPDIHLSKRWYSANGYKIVKGKPVKVEVLAERSGVQLKRNKLGGLMCPLPGSK